MNLVIPTGLTRPIGAHRLTEHYVLLIAVTITVALALLNNNRRSPAWCWISRTPDSGGDGDRSQRRRHRGADHDRSRRAVHADKTPGGRATLVVRAGGFAEKAAAASTIADDIEIVLAPAALLETVTVTPSRSEERLGNIPASINILDARRDQKLAGASSPTTCCARSRPSACSAARAACRRIPPTQGVSLRGIGPSGVSRTLVLVDGVPFNDPFGGWVYWTRVPMESVDRIEVVDGSSSSLYGNYAMGGVINIVGSRPSRRTVELRDAVRQPEQPEARLLRQRRVGQARRRRRRQLLRHRRLSDRRSKTSASVGVNPAASTPRRP